MTNPDVIAKRLLQRAHNRDGLPEILIGVQFLMVAGGLYAQSTLPHKSFGFVAVVLALACGMPAVIWLGPRWLKWVRRRYLVEREGYVEYLPRPKSSRYAVWVVAIVVLMALVAFISFQPLPEWWIPGLTGLAGGVLMGVCGREPRFYLAGLIMAVTGVNLAIAKTTMDAGFIILFTVQGVVEVVMGGFTWTRFVSETNARAKRDER